MMLDSKDFIAELDAAGLRAFGLMMGGFISVPFGLLFPWLLGFEFPLWPWLVGGAIALWAVIAPTYLRPVYRGWMHLALVMNRITTPLILGIVFFAVIVPFAFAMKLIGRDSMSRRFDNTISSYRVASRTLSKKHVERPF